MSCSQIFAPTYSKKTSSKEADTEISRHIDKHKKRHPVFFFPTASNPLLNTQDVLNNITDMSRLLVKVPFENLIHTLLPLIYTNNKAINKSYDGNSTLLKLFSLIHNLIWKNKEM